MLNLARPDVRDYVLGFLDKLVTENDIAFLKWDYNRNWSEPGWDQLPAGGAEAGLRRLHPQPLLRSLPSCEKRHPKLEIESCSGGGGRVDLGILQYTDEVWPSDNTDPFDRISQQDGFTYAYTPQVMMAWVTDSPDWHGRRTFLPALSDAELDAGLAGHRLQHSSSGMTSRWPPPSVSSPPITRCSARSCRAICIASFPRGMAASISATQTVNAEKSQSVVFAFLHSTQTGAALPAPQVEGARSRGNLYSHPD